MWLHRNKYNEMYRKFLQMQDCHMKRVRLFKESVMDDVHKQRGIAPETVKTKVIQELEKVSFGAKEPIK